MSLNIVSCGSENEAAVGRMCARAFESLGHDVTYVDQSIHSPPLLGSVGYGISEMRKRVIRNVVAASPDIVFVVKGYQLDRKTIERLCERTEAVIVNWNPDNPFQVRSKHQLAETYLNSLPTYDAVFTWGEFLMDDLREYGARRVEHLPFGYDPTLHRPTEPRADYECDVIFLGHWSGKRERILSGISGMDGVDFDLWGNHWKFRCWDWSLRRSLRGDALMGDPYAQAMSSAKLVVNVVADHNVPAYNMRTFEIPATRSLMLTTDTPGQREILPHGEGAVMYQDRADLCEQVRYYLDADEEREAIAAAGYERVQGHSYRDRMKRVVDVVEDVR